MSAVEGEARQPGSFDSARNVARVLHAVEFEFSQIGVDEYSLWIWGSRGRKMSQGWDNWEVRDVTEVEVKMSESGACAEDFESLLLSDASMWELIAVGRGWELPNRDWAEAPPSSRHSPRPA